MRPKLICLTPVKNEEWILDFFLACTSLWADHIIIADQNSADNTIEIVKKHKKAILIRNNQNEYNEEFRQKLLLEEARKISGDKILITLDADEIFTANFLETNDWKRILDSKPGEVFGFQWANVTPDLKHYFVSEFHYPWAFHDDGTKHEKYVKYLHSMRIPFPESAENGWIKINDFRVLHFNWANDYRVKSKNRFYQCLVVINEKKENPVSLYRSYNLTKKRKYLLPEMWFTGYLEKGIDFFNSIDYSERVNWFDLKVIFYIKEFGAKKFQFLDIWQKEWIRKMDNQLRMVDPRNFMIKTLHLYFRLSHKIYPSSIVRIVDKMLKKVLKNKLSGNV